MTPLYAGIGGVVRELTEMDAGINGVVTPLTEMWAGVGGVNRQIFSAVPELVNVQISLTDIQPSLQVGYVVSYIDETSEIQTVPITSNTEKVQIITPKGGLISISGSGLGVAHILSVFDHSASESYDAYSSVHPKDGDPQVNGICTIAILAEDGMDLKISWSW